MNAVDFVLYCAGGGIITISSAAAFKIVVKALEPLVTQKPVPRPTPLSQSVQLPDPIEEGLGARIKALQNTRFGAPITTRQLTPDMGPQTRPYSRPHQPEHDFVPRAPGPTQVKLPPRAALRTVPAVKERNVVVQLPIKQKTDAPKKDE